MWHKNGRRCRQAGDATRPPPSGGGRSRGGYTRWVGNARPGGGRSAGEGVPAVDGLPVGRQRRDAAPRPKGGLGIGRRRREGVPHPERSPEVERPDRRPRQRPGHDDREDRDRGRPFLGAPPLRRLAALEIEGHGDRAKGDQEGHDPQRDDVPPRSSRRLQQDERERGCENQEDRDQQPDGIVEIPSRQARRMEEEEGGWKRRGRRGANLLRPSGGARWSRRLAFGSGSIGFPCFGSRRAGRS